MAGLPAQALLNPHHLRKEEKRTKHTLRRGEGMYDVSLQRNSIQHLEQRKQDPRFFIFQLVTMHARFYVSGWTELPMEKRGLWFGVLATPGEGFCCPRLRRDLRQLAEWKVMLRLPAC
jgi:hypothetical protein